MYALGSCYFVQKTRAEAMLERAKLQPQQCTVDPLDNAARWSIPIWPLEKVSSTIIMKAQCT